MINPIKSFYNLYLHLKDRTNRPTICDSLRLWAPSRPDWQIIPIHPAFKLTPNLPKGLCTENPELAKRFIANTELAFSGQFLFAIPRATVRGACFTVLPEGAFVIEGNWRATNVIYHPHFSKRSLRNKRTLSGNWYPILSYYSHSYHHWLWNDLPRLMTSLPHLPDDVKFLIPENPSDYHVATLKALGIPSDRLLQQKSSDETVVDKLWLSTPLGDSEWAATDPNVAAQLREKLQESYSLPTAQTDRKLFISRSKARQRRIVNENELTSLLTEFGFETVFAEELSFPEQVSLFSQAATILGVHGAGLTNMLHSKPGVKVMEIHVNNTDIARTHYWMMSEILGHHYAHFIAKEIKTKTNNLDSDMYIEPHTFRNFLWMQNNEC